MKNVNNVQENNNVNYLNINPQHQQQPKQPVIFSNIYYKFLKTKKIGV